MDEFDKWCLKHKKIIGSRYIKKVDKIGNIITAFDTDFLEEILKRSKSKRIGKYVYICKKTKKNEYILAILQKRKRVMLLAEVEPDDNLLVGEYKGQEEAHKKTQAK